MDQFSLTSDFVSSTGPTEKCLRQTAQAGFTHVHWCHHWRDDFFYTDPETEEIALQLSGLGLQLADVHGSVGDEKNWHSLTEYARRAGVELVKNRVDFTSRLGGDCVVLHGPRTFNEQFEDRMSAMNRSLVELEPYCRERGIRLALEILPEKGGYEQVLFPALKAFSREFLGFCYDVGHHNITKDSDDLVRKNECRDQISDRLFAVHVHDNDGAEDRHWIPFTGTVDWQNVADFLRTANYSKPLNLEINFAKSGLEDEDLFLRQARQSIARLRSMVDGVANR